MSEYVLYRKYRPKNFKEVIGQDHIVKALKGAIDAGNLSHAYLFAGTRGIGKTSIARILAKEIGTSEKDLYEVDAASNTGVDDIRSLNESVSTSPFDSKYKFYIIDEVHMLSKSAFNAFLKTLEEPPKHVIFVLATTEIHKIPDTIISRCEVHTFKKPTQKVLKDLVLSVAKKEGFSIDPSSADLVALLGDGSFRDTLGTLQKVIGASTDLSAGKQAQAGKKVTVEEVEAITGAPQAEVVNNVIEAIVGKDIDKGLSAIHSASDANADMKVFAKLILQKLRFVLLLRFAPKMEERIEGELSDTDFEFVKKLSKEKDITLSSQTLVELINASDAIGRSSIPQLPLELALVSLAGNEPTTNDQQPTTKD